MLEKDGVATIELIAGVCPTAERRKKGAYAVIECFQKIPCNPCYSSCPKAAINNMEDINTLPKVDFDKCNGCGICANNCPGLAIFIVDETYSPTHALVKVPYEFLPLPAKSDTVTATNREGKRICSALVVNVLNGKAQDKTPSVWLAVPKELAMEVRCFTLEETYGDKNCDENNVSIKDCCGGNKDSCLPIENITDETYDNTYVCRCEEVTIGDLREYIAKGYTTLSEIKVMSRAGMGACQGRTCRHLIMGELAKANNQKPEDMPVTTFRPPVKPIKMSLLCDKND